MCLAPGSIASHSMEAENASSNSSNLNLLIGTWTQKLRHNYTIKYYRVKLKKKTILFNMINIKKKTSIEQKKNKLQEDMVLFIQNLNTHKAILEIIYRHNAM